MISNLLLGNLSLSRARAVTLLVVLDTTRQQFRIFPETEQILVKIKLFLLLVVQVVVQVVVHVVVVVVQVAAVQAVDLLMVLKSIS